MPRPSPPSAQNRARDTARATDGRTTGPQSSQPSRHARARGNGEVAARCDGRRRARHSRPRTRRFRRPGATACRRRRPRPGPPGAARVEAARRRRRRAAPAAAFGAMATSGIDGHRPGGAEAGGRKEVFRHRWRTRSPKGRRRARRPEAGRGRGGERCGAVAMQAAHNRQPATASGAARAAATACAITEGPPVRPGRVPCARCGRAATARRRSRGVGRLTRARPTTAGRRAAASPRTRGRGRQDDRVHVRAICAIVSRRDCWMCRGPLLAPVVARTLRGSEGKSGRCSCERSPATAPRGAAHLGVARDVPDVVGAVLRRPASGWSVSCRTCPLGRGVAGVDGKEGDQYSFSVPNSQCQGSKGLL